MSVEHRGTGGRCWSWKHDSQYDQPMALDGRRTCAAHLDEEDAIAAVDKALMNVAAAHDKVRSTGARGGPIYVSMVEGAIARFMEDATVDFRIGKGHSVSRDASSDRPRQSELDLVVDWESAPWYGHGRLVDEGPPVLAHIEVGLRSRSDKHKLNKDLERLRATIERAQAAGKKTWTAVVCLGSSHSPRETAELLGQWCGETAVSKARADDGTWWPIPDVIITPSHSWLKAEVMPTEATGPQPVWILQVGDPCEDDKLRKWRPLAFARAKLANYLAMRGRLTDEWLERPLESAHLGPRGRQGSLVAVAPCKAHYRCATWESGQRVYVLQVDPERRWELHCTGEAR